MTPQEAYKYYIIETIKAHNAQLIKENKLPDMITFQQLQHKAFADMKEILNSAAYNGEIIPHKSVNCTLIEIKQ